MGSFLMLSFLLTYHISTPNLPLNISPSSYYPPSCEEAGARGRCHAEPVSVPLLEAIIGKLDHWGLIIYINPLLIFFKKESNRRIWLQDYCIVPF